MARTAGLGAGIEDLGRRIRDPVDDLGEAGVESRCGVTAFAGERLS